MPSPHVAGRSWMPCPRRNERLPITEKYPMSTMDIAITFPGQGRIRLQSRALFEEPGNETCRKFLERVFQAPEITDVTINSHEKAGELPHADLRFSCETYTLPEVVRRISGCLDPSRKQQAAGNETAKATAPVQDGANG